VIPGISEHSCPLIEVNIKPLRRSQKPRTIRLYKKANWDSFRNELHNTAAKIKEMESTHTAQELWSVFKTAVTEGIDRHIPSKTRKDSLPYHSSKTTKN